MTARLDAIRRLVGDNRPRNLSVADAPDGDGLMLTMYLPAADGIRFAANSADGLVRSRTPVSLPDGVTVIGIVEAVTIDADGGGLTMVLRVTDETAHEPTNDRRIN